MFLGSVWVCNRMLPPSYLPEIVCNPHPDIVESIHNVALLQTLLWKRATIPDFNFSGGWVGLVRTSSKCARNGFR